MIYLNYKLNYLEFLTQIPINSTSNEGILMHVLHKMNLKVKDPVVCAKCSIRIVKVAHIIT